MPSDKRLYVFNTFLDHIVSSSRHVEWITDDYDECLLRLNECIAVAGEDYVRRFGAKCRVMTYDQPSKTYRFDHRIFLSPSQISADDFTCENREDIASMLKNNLDSVQIRFHIRAQVLDRTIDRHVSTTLSIINERENDMCDVLCNDILAKDKLNPRYYIEDRLREGQLCHNAVNDAVNALLSNYTDLLVRDALSEIQRDFQNNADNP